MHLELGLSKAPLFRGSGACSERHSVRCQSPLLSTVGAGPSQGRWLLSAVEGSGG
jgi:hypothetical protein